MSQEDAAEKPFEATPHKLEQARKKGEVPKSTEITTAGAYLGLLAAIAFFGENTMNSFSMVLQSLIEFPDELAMLHFGGDASSLSSSLLLASGSIGLILVGTPVVFVILAVTVQRGWVFSAEKIKPKLSRLSPIAGAKNKFGPNGLFEFLKSSTKLVLVSLLLVWFSVGHLDDLLLVVSGKDNRHFELAVRLVTEFLLLLFVMSLLIGTVDYVWQLKTHLKKNMMSRKEIEDETKSNDGDPHHKQTRRRRGYDIAMNQMLADVPEADVILVNPTHYAVALKWNRNSAGAPVCVAKGIDEIASRIRDIALASQIPIHSDPPTTRAVFATVEIGMQVLPEHYSAVAAAIRFAETMRKKAAKT